jgi:hypothetical protein
VEAAVIAYKFLRPDGTTIFTRFAWPLPGAGPGAWVEADVDPCRSGLHACRVADLPFWAGQALFELELDGPVAEEATKVVAARARITRRVGAWEEGVRDVYTRMCADRAHELARDAGLDTWDAGVEAAVASGPASLGFIAAWIAEQRWGPEGFALERRRQADWLADHLGLAAA